MEIKLGVYNGEGEFEVLKTLNAKRVPAVGEEVHLRGRKIGDDPAGGDGWLFKVIDVRWSADTDSDSSDGDDFSEALVALEVRPLESEFKFASLCDCEKPDPDGEDLRQCFDCGRKLREQPKLTGMPAFWVWDYDEREIIPVSSGGLVQHVFRHSGGGSFTTVGGVKAWFERQLQENAAKGLMGYRESFVVTPVRSAKSEYWKLVGDPGDEPVEVAERGDPFAVLPS